MAKTFAPTLAKRLKAINLYAVKHAAPLAATLTAAQQASLQRIQSEVSTNFSVPTAEVP